MSNPNFQQNTIYLYAFSTSYGKKLFIMQKCIKISKNFSIIYQKLKITSFVLYFIKIGVIIILVRCMKECKSCGAIWDEGDICPYCHRHIIIENPKVILPDSNISKNNKHKFLKTLFVLAAVISVPVIFSDCLSSEKSDNTHHSLVSHDTEHDKVKSIEYQQEKGIYVSGIYEIGKDIPEGEYIICSDGGTPDKNFYMGVYTSSSCSDESQIYGDWYQGNTIAVLEEGQFIEVSHGNIYDREKSGIKLSPFTESGMFRAGEDIPAGDYIVKSDNSQYTGTYVVYSSLNSVAPIIKESGFIEDEKITKIVLSDGEYVETRFCCLEED